MKSFFKPLMLGLVVGVMSLMPIGKAHSQSLPEPAVVVSVASFKEQMGDINYLLSASGFAEMKFMAQAMVKGYTKGIDTEKNAGALMFFNEGSDEPDVLGFLPVTDIDEVLDTIAQMAEVEEKDDLIIITTDAGVEVMAREVGGFAYFSNKKSLLENLDGDPAKMLGELPSKYNLSVKLFAQRVPQQLREELMSMIRDGSREALQNLDSELDPEVQEKNLETQMKQMESLFRDTESMTFGMAADKDSKNLFVDVEFKALANTDLASKMAYASPKQPSRFTGFLMDGAAMTHNMCARVSEEEAKQYSDMMDSLKATMIKEMDQDGDLSDEDMKSVERLVGNLIEVGKATFKEGLIDAGAVVMLKDGEINFAAGGQVADPRQVESTFKELVAIAQEKTGNQLEVNLNSGSHKDTTFHQVVVQIPDDEEEMRDAIGDQITIVVGIGTKEVYLGAGSNPMQTLKDAIDGTHMAKDLAQYNFYVTPMLKFAANLQGDPSIEAMADALEAAGNDRISMTSNSIENGVKMRFEIQDGILSLIKVGVNAFSGGGGGSPGSDDDF